METSGRLVGAVRNVLTGKLNITFEIDSIPNIDELQQLGQLTITADKFRKKRSLDANKYFHLLVGKIAPRVNLSYAHCKNLLIARYGKPELLDDGSIMYYKSNAPEEYMLELETIHCFPVRYENGGTFYRVMRGSHTYDSKEMSELIKGTVEEAETLGIDTATPDEIQRMLTLWERNHNQSSQMTQNAASYAEDLM